MFTVLIYFTIFLKRNTQNGQPGAHFRCYVGMYVWWFSFILGSNFLFFCFKLIIMLLSYITIPKNKRKCTVPFTFKFVGEKNRCIHSRCSPHTRNKNTVLTCTAGVENRSAGLRQANNTGMFCTFKWYACMFFVFVFSKNTLVCPSRYSFFVTWPLS